MVDEVVIGVVPLHGVEVGAVRRRAVVHVEVDHVVRQVPFGHMKCYYLDYSMLWYYVRHYGTYYLLVFVNIDI